MEPSAVNKPVLVGWNRYCVGKTRSLSVSNKMGPLMLVAGLIVLALIAFPIIKACAAPADAEPIAAEILKAPTFQSDFPIDQIKPEEEEEPWFDCDWGEDEEEEQPQPQFTPRDSQTPFEFGPVGKAVLWMLAIVAGMVLLARLFMGLQQWRDKKIHGTGMSPGGNNGGYHVPLPTGEEADDLDMDEAARLARTGAYSDAIRMLLFYCLQRMEDLPEINSATIGPLTGREILNNAPVSDEAKRALQPIIAAEELGHFGGKSATQPLYQSCRNSYNQFLDSMDRSDRTNMSGRSAK